MKKSIISNFVVWLALVLLATPLLANNVMPTLSFDDEEEPPAIVAPSGQTTADAQTATPVPEVAKPVEAVVEPEEIKESFDLDAVRADAIEFLREKTTKQDADGLIVPPVRRRLIVGTTMVDTRCSEKMVDQNIYKTVQEYRNVKVGDSVNAVLVRKKVNVQKKVGTKKVKKLVRDPNGDIIAKFPKHEYGPGGPDEWNAFQFGNNAMAIYAMMRSGVDSQDEVVLTVAEHLGTIYEQYGLPDLTWDLAWSTAAFSLIDQPRFQKLAN